ncbi:MAG: 1-acyl-sn-glycerol-3-phosphate acyltransferase [Candidatus Omnitrophica bacterium]|nr:1-acyl-sn-glycerol-3-phosphate acyltransferase [Candidatus Omnitrophota bacterium]
MIYLLIRRISFVLFRLGLGLRVSGVENIPSEGAFILAANHASYLDPLVLIAVSPRRLHFIARETLFSATLLGWVVRHIETISLKRGGRDKGAVKAALKLLHKGGALGLFPEGTRSKTRELKRARPGIGMFAAKAKVPVVPVYIEGTFDAMPRGVRTVKLRPIRVIIGKPLSSSLPNTGKDAYEGISEKVMRSIAELRDVLPLNVGRGT